jgi:hypothetical protein
MFIVFLNACSNADKQKEVTAYSIEIKRIIREQEIIDSVKQVFVEQEKQRELLRDITKQEKSTRSFKQYDGKHSYLVTFDYPEEWSCVDYKLSASTDVLLYLIPDYYKQHKIIFKVIRDISSLEQMKNIINKQYDNCELKVNENFLSKHDIYVWHYEYVLIPQGESRNKYNDTYLIDYLVIRNTGNTTPVLVGTNIDIRNVHIFEKLTKDLLDIIMSMKIYIQ